MENLPKIAFLPDMRASEVSNRMLFDMKPVLYAPETMREDKIFYKVFRNLYVVNGKIRYDITVIPPGSVGGEFPKTFGHYHKGPQPEIYELLAGHAYFLIQKQGLDPSEIKEAYIIEARAGEKAVMPPDFGHLTINVGKEDLVLANWIGLVDYDYETIKKYRGGCYYVLEKGNKIEFKKNPNYKLVPEIKKLKLKDLPDFGIKNGSQNPIADLKNTPEKMDWLINPKKYIDKLTIKNLYREI